METSNGFDWVEKCVAVVPCLNEEVAIRQLVEGLRPHLKHVLVVDDGSTDRTAEVAREAGAQVLRHNHTRGKGAALRAGWTEASRREFVWALSLDGDGQHSPLDIPEFFKCADQTGTALV